MTVEIQVIFTYKNYLYDVNYIVQLMIYNGVLDRIKHKLNRKLIKPLLEYQSVTCPWWLILYLSPKMSVVSSPS